MLRKSHLSLEGNITIVYGNNGSGKSGYVRLLKHVCGARRVPSTAMSISPALPYRKPAFRLSRTAFQESYVVGQGTCDDLKVLIFSPLWQGVCQRRRGELRAAGSIVFQLAHPRMRKGPRPGCRAQRHQSKKPNIPTDRKATPEGIWYEAIAPTPVPRTSTSIAHLAALTRPRCKRCSSDLTKRHPRRSEAAEKSETAHRHCWSRMPKSIWSNYRTTNYRRIIAAKKKSILKDCGRYGGAKGVLRQRAGRHRL